MNRHSASESCQKSYLKMPCANLYDKDTSPSHRTQQMGALINCKVNMIRLNIMKLNLAFITFTIILLYTTEKASQCKPVRWTSPLIMICLSALRATVSYFCLAHFIKASSACVLSWKHSITSEEPLNSIIMAKVTAPDWGGSSKS